MIKIFAGIGMGWVLFVAYVLLKCSLESFQKMEKKRLQDQNAL